MVCENPSRSPILYRFMRVSPHSVKKKPPICSVHHPSLSIQTQLVSLVKLFIMILCTSRFSIVRSIALPTQRFTSVFTPVPYYCRLSFRQFSHYFHFAVAFFPKTTAKTSGTGNRCRLDNPRAVENPHHFPLNRSSTDCAIVLLFATFTFAHLSLCTMHT